MSGAALGRVAAMRSDDYDPGLVVAAVNALQPLGKDAALAEIAKTPESPPANGLFWVLRVLFDVADPPGFPPVHLGTPLIPPPSDPGRLARYPIALVRDVPLLVAGGYVLRGLAEPVRAHIDYYREHGSARDRPLEPAESPDDVRDELLELWTSAGGEHREQVLHVVSAQLARMG